MSKRKVVDIVGYVDHISPRKEKSFRFTIQCGKNDIKKATCFDNSKLNELTRSQESCEPIKMVNVVSQEVVKDSHAEIIVNSSTALTKPRPSDLDFDRSEQILQTTTIDALHKSKVGQLVSVAGKMDLSKGKLKEVICFGSTNTVMENAYIYDESGVITIHFWNEWIKYINKKIEEHASSFVLHNVMLKYFDATGLYLSTCSATYLKTSLATFETKELPLENDPSEVTLVTIRSVKQITYCYVCLW